MHISSINGEPKGPYHRVRSFVSPAYKHGDDGPWAPSPSSCAATSAPTSSAATPADSSSTWRL